MKFVASGIMGAVNAGMATDTSMDAMALDAERDVFTEDEKEILDEIDKQERELLAIQSQAGFIEVDQREWNSMRDYDPVDRSVEDQFGTFYSRIDNLTTKNFS